MHIVPNATKMCNELQAYTSLYTWLHKYNMHVHKELWEE